MPYSAGRMLASKIAYSARNSTGRIYPRSLVCVCSYCRDPGNIYLRNPEYWNSEFSSRNTIGIRNISSFDKESAIQFLESKTVLYDKSARWPAEYHKTSELLECLPDACHKSTPFEKASATKVSSKIWIVSFTSKGPYKNGRRWGRLAEQSHFKRWL